MQELMDEGITGKGPITYGSGVGIAMGPECRKPRRGEDL